LDAPSGFAGLLNGREEERDQNANDGNDDKQLDQSECARSVPKLPQSEGGRP